MARIVALTIFILLSHASIALAGFNLKADGATILAWSCVGFVALFVIAQMIPACIQCVELLREALSGRFIWRNR
ncbi:MAG: hypothetical protein RBR02_06820 [Desulfuromonadaceae bacterium]|nr:hypothetical protein [Desulfuromonadaceae bacterium]